MSILPPEVRAGYVVDRVLRAIGDRPYDDDRLPDGIPAQGKVIFRPKNAVKQLVSEGRGVTVTREPVTCTIHQGENQPDDPDPEKGGLLIDEAGHVGGVWLVVGEWTVEYHMEDRYSNIPNEEIIVTEEHTEENPLDIALASELTPTPTQKFVVNEQIYVDSKKARDEAKGFRDEAEGFRNDAEQVVIGVEDSVSTAIDSEMETKITPAFDAAIATAKGHSTDAGNSATAAATSETNAAISETNAAESADEATIGAGVYREIAKLNAKNVWEQDTPPTSGYTYEWAGTPHRSETIKKLDGVEVARNIVDNPQFTDNFAGWSNVRADVSYSPYGEGIAIHPTTSASGTIRQSYRIDADNKYFSVKIPARGEDFVVWVVVLGSYGSHQFIAELVDGYADITAQIPSGTETIRLQIGAYGSRTAYFGFPVMVIADTEKDAFAHTRSYFDGDTPDERVSDVWIDGEGTYHYWKDGHNWSVLAVDRPDGIPTLVDHQTAERAEIAADRSEDEADRSKDEADRSEIAADNAQGVADLLGNLTIDGEVPITVDTSVGTRVFVGDTMIYGDTGWRDMKDQLINGWVAGEFMVRRINSTVYIQAGSLSNQNATSTWALDMPPGFRTGNANNTVVGLLQFSSIFSNTVIWGIRGGSGGRNLQIEIGTDSPSLAGQLTFNTPNSWPTSLPGLPA